MSFRWTSDLRLFCRSISCWSLCRDAFLHSAPNGQIDDVNASEWALLVNSLLLTDGLTDPKVSRWIPYWLCGIHGKNNCCHNLDNP